MEDSGVEPLSSPCKGDVSPLALIPQRKLIMYHYTYLIVFKPTKKFYYGVRTSNCLPIDDLWVKYFTSSTIIKGLLEANGPDVFAYEVRRIFKTRKAANRCEERCLRQIDALQNRACLNKAINSNYSFTKSSRMSGKRHSESTKLLLSLMSKGRKHSDETRHIISSKMAIQRNTPQWREHMSAMAGAPKSDKHRHSMKTSQRCVEQRQKLYEVVTCPHCQKQGAKNIMARWHFDRCTNIH